MITQEQIYVGNRFAGEEVLLEIVEIKTESKKEYVHFKDLKTGRIHRCEAGWAKKLLLTEVNK